MPENNTNTTADVTPQAEATKATDAQPDQKEQDTFDREYVEKLRQEAAKYRTQLREKEEAEKAAAEAKRKAEQTAEERAKEAEQKAQKALEQAEQRVQTAERKAALTGKVANPDRVMRLMDDPETYFDGTNPDVDAILKDFPEYAPTNTGTTPVNGVRGRASGITIEQMKNMTPQEINDRWDEIQSTLGKKR